MLYKNKCGWCGDQIDSFATDRRGTLPLVFCSSPCETSYKQDKRFSGSKNIVNLHKGLTTEELTKRISTKKWQGYQYNSRPEVVI